MLIYKIIPFRLDSNRFPGKPLCKFEGKTLIERAFEHASRISAGKIVLTASQKDFSRVNNEIDLSKWNFEFLVSSENCTSATERVMEISQNLEGNIFISIPIDEPVLNTKEIGRVMHIIENEIFDVYTLYCDFYVQEDAESGLSAKIVLNCQEEILYMSRSVIPLNKDGTYILENLKKNVGVFIYRREFLDALRVLKDKKTYLDQWEGLEQLRWLELGFKLKAYKIKHVGFGIDKEEQLEKLTKRMEQINGRKNCSY